MIHYNDHTLIKLLKSTERQDNDKAMLFLYQQLFFKVERYVQRNSGDSSDAADVFQDGLIVLYKSVRQEKIPADAKVQAYLYSVCRNLWLKQLGKSKRKVALMEEHENIPSGPLHLDKVLSDEKSELVDKLLHQLGASCRQLLVYFYYDRLKIREIAKLMNFSSEQVAKNKKSACMKKLRAILDEHPELKELLR
ncbi:MAG: sigma-70 family RNA polymerase sigma factor [Bacteroidota bacterium]